MEDKIYRNIRKILFWSFFLSFFIVLPLVIFYSLGYQFNSKLRSFQKTGIISIRSMPMGADIYLDDRRLNKETPYDIRNLLPKIYKIRLEKDGFFPYEVNLEVRSSFVSSLEAILIPKLKDIEKIKEELNIFNFFVIEHIFGKKIIILAKEGIYIFNEDLEEIAKVSPINLDVDTLASIKGVKEEKNKLILYNKNNIWIIDYAGWWSRKDLILEHIYRAKEDIKSVFFSLKDRYLIIQEGSKVIALDTKNRDVIFDIYNLNSLDASIYYDNNSDTLFIKDKIYPSDRFSLFKINITKKIYEKSTD